MFFEIVLMTALLTIFIIALSFFVKYVLKDHKSKELMVKLKIKEYPKLTKDEQLHLIYYNDWNELRKKVNYYKPLSKTILNHVIDITESELNEYLHHSNLLEDKNIANAGNRDGVWIREYAVENDRFSYEIVRQKKSKIESVSKFDNIDLLIDSYTRELFSVVPKFREKFNQIPDIRSRIQV